MVALNFQSQFADAVEFGRKTQTIRARSRAKPGDILQLYTGQRTKGCRKLRDVICKGVHTVLIAPEFVEVDGARYVAKKDEFAERDGFKSYDDMYDFFCSDHGEEFFNGYLITW